MVRYEVTMCSIAYIALCTWVAQVCCLSLPFQVTSKPRFTKYSSPTPPPPQYSGVAAAAVAANTPSPAAATVPNGVGLYRVATDNGDTCILMRTDALIEIEFTSHIGEEKGDTYMPENALVEGTCQEDDSSMRITWSGYALVIYFSKTPGGERWYISNLDLTVSTELKHYHNIKTPSKSFKLYHNKMLAPTPVGRSHECDEVEIPLVPREGDDRVPADLRGVLFLRALRLQPFMYRGADFGQAYKCGSQRSARSETAPIAVGSTLAIAVLLTVGGYGLFRYFKVNNVHYNTME